MSTEKRRAGTYVSDNDLASGIDYFLLGVVANAVIRGAWRLLRIINEPQLDRISNHFDAFLDEGLEDGRPHDASNEFQGDRDCLKVKVYRTSGTVCFYFTVKKKQSHKKRTCDA
jgi:hypothetical protein